MISITIPGKPIAQNRPRFTRRGKSVTTYSDQESEAGKFFLLAKEQIQCDPMEGPLVMCATFVMPIPKSMPKKIRSKAYGFLPHEKKPDLDNLIKFVKDCLNGLAWKDDSQVYCYGNPTLKKIW